MSFLQNFTNRNCFSDRTFQGVSGRFRESFREFRGNHWIETIQNPCFSCFWKNLASTFCFSKFLLKLKKLVGKTKNTKSMDCRTFSCLDLWDTLKTMKNMDFRLFCLHKRWKNTKNMDLGFFCFRKRWKAQKERIFMFFLQTLKNINNMDFTLLVFANAENITKHGCSPFFANAENIRTTWK